MKKNLAAPCRSRSNKRSPLPRLPDCVSQVNKMHRFPDSALYAVRRKGSQRACDALVTEFPLRSKRPFGPMSVFSSLAWERLGSGVGGSLLFDIKSNKLSGDLFYCQLRLPIQRSVRTLPLSVRDPLTRSRNPSRRAECL